MKSETNASALVAIVAVLFMAFLYGIAKLEFETRAGSCPPTPPSLTGAAAEQFLAYAKATFPGRCGTP